MPSLNNRKALFTLVTIALGAWVRPSQAHVKWFCSYDVASAPRTLHMLANPGFGYLVLLTLAILLVAALIDGTLVGRAILRSLDRVTWPLKDAAEPMLRVGLAAFFICLALLGGIILTPELHTTARWVPWLQAGIALCLASRRTMPISALGIVVLYAKAIDDYCLFHLLDYPIFLGLALYLVLASRGWRPWGQSPLDILRYAAAITLMWASVEKWAYPQWTYPLLARHPEMTFGFDSRFYMDAAGIVEFALAFTLACGPLMRRVSAILLAAMFISAIAEFGRIDALGHSPIIVALIAMIADRGGAQTPNPAFRWRYALGTPAVFCSSFAATVAIYYGLHAMLYASQMS